mmetsp:Transcript_1082/g.1735  ORF Transcript_1082/g.1735 Transcript_1082/m.1735 type:complete len:331 (+) Transcript_1082:116-1108(+)
MALRSPAPVGGTQISVAAPPQGNTQLRKIDPDGNLIPRDKDTSRIPSVFQCFTKESFKLNWLQLGDDEGGDDVRDQVVNEQNNVALTSALMLTIQFALLFYLPDLPWSDVEEKWGKTFVNYSLDYSIMFTMVGIAINWLGMVFSIILLLILNELNGPSEITTMIRMLGTKASSGFLMLVLGLIFTALVSLYISFIFQREWWNMVVSIVVVLAVCAGLSYWLFGPTFHTLFKVKAISCSTKHPPAVLSAFEVRKSLNDFVQTIGVEFLSPKALERFVLEEMVQKENIENKEVKVYRALAYVSKQRLDAAVNKYVQDLLTKEEREEQTVAAS